MWSMVSIIVLALGIFSLEFPRLQKKNRKKEAWFFTIFLLSFTIISVLESSEVNLPNPLDFIQSFYKMIGF
ncbi:hypothetical protein GLW00_01400 [Halobacillus litoralis]|uniref:Uncharacterized protein n=1 Tax=Halobacillus litoralis TaxID=45668 RepID=A0A845F5U8_9BACI|nr:hypothetical protein [Halobacillus litoralis]MYL69483.1 hypothetical protein [Halobacillus litoralis]